MPDRNQARSICALSASNTGQCRLPCNSQSWRISEHLKVNSRLSEIYAAFAQWARQQSIWIRIFGPLFHL